MSSLKSTEPEVPFEVITAPVYVEGRWLCRTVADRRKDGPPGRALLWVEGWTGESWSSGAGGLPGMQQVQQSPPAPPAILHEAGVPEDPFPPGWEPPRPIVPWRELPEGYSRVVAGLYPGTRVRDQLRIEVRRSQNEFGEEFDEAVIWINGELLVDILRDVERPFAEAEGRPERPGRYVGLDPKNVLLPSRHLLDEPSPWYDYGEKVAVLQCPGLTPSDQPLLARIRLYDDVVVWSDFENPFRNDEAYEDYGTPPWRYDALRELVFDRKAYEVALSRDS